MVDYMRNPHKNIKYKQNNQGAERRNFCAFSLQQKEISQMDVIMLGFAGLQGSISIAENKADELQTRFALSFMQQAIMEKKELLNKDKILKIKEIMNEGAVACESGEYEMYELGSCGVFMGLWNMAQEAGVGLEIILNQIPIKQETIEICNFYDINPYQMLSGGSWLFFTPHGNRVVQKLHQMSIPASVIGITTNNKDRVICNGDERRFIEKKYEEALDKIK